jgi:hypothetical protein
MERVMGTEPNIQPFDSDGLILQTAKRNSGHQVIKRLQTELQASGRLSGKTHSGRMAGTMRVQDLPLLNNHDDSINLLACILSCYRHLN